MKIYLLLFFLLSLNACSHFTKLKPVKTNEAVTLKLSHLVGKSDTTKYYSNTVIKDFEGGQITREKHEIVEFDVLDKIKAFDFNNSFVTYEITTTKKDGAVDLHELAFPEVKEIVQVIYTTQGQVVKYGDYPPRSVFYVPPISLPKEPVQVGDSWPLRSSWIGLKSGVPLRLEMVSILKNIYSCGMSGRCADIEVSGNLYLEGFDKQNIKFESELRGRLLFSIDNGNVLWSKSYADEIFIKGDTVSKVKSCLVSKLIKPKTESWRPAKSPTCDPSKQDSISVPGT